MNCPNCAGKPQGLEELVRTAVRNVLREELPRLLAPPGAMDLVDIEEAARRLGLGVSTVRKRAAAGELARVKDGRRLLFRPADLDAYTERRRLSPEKVKAAVRAAEKDAAA